MYSQLLSLVKTLSPILFYKTIYEEQHNPEIWPGLCQTGLEQSPININLSETIGVREANIVYNGYSNFFNSIIVSNDGLSIEAKFQGANFNPSVTLNRETYSLIEVHFHWGASEHSINGKSFAGEVHLVHRNSNQNFLVLAALLEETFFSKNLLSRIIRFGGQTVTKVSSNATLQIVSTLEEFLDPINLNKYFTYRGSLTTPNCNEDVLWFVYQETIKVDAQSIKSLKNLEDKNGQKLKCNSRNIQPLNKRKIYKTFN